MIWYDLMDDLEAYPDATIYIIIGGRNTGKTYSALKAIHYTLKKNFIFLKRTQEDVDLLCSGSGRLGAEKADFGFDLSPFKSLNRDLGSAVKAFPIKKGLGGFWNTDEEGGASGPVFGYLLGLTAVYKYKGFDLSDCDFIIFDEFIPRKWDRNVSRGEGESVMDLYKTVDRGREISGRPPLKLIALANATMAANPLCQTLEIVDTIVDMQLKRQSYCYLKERGILIHMLYDNEEFQEQESKSSIYRAMAGTAWAEMALNNDFGYDDFTSVKKVRLKGYQPAASYRYKSKRSYIWLRDGKWYIGPQRFKRPEHVREYNLDQENDQKLFYYDHVIDLRNDCMEGRVDFAKFSDYDLIINYKKYFTI